MAVIKMSKINILLHKEDKVKVLDLLQEQGVMEIIDKKETISSDQFTQEVYNIDYKLAEIEFALKFLAPFAPAPQGMDGLIFGEKIQVSSLDEVNLVSQTFFYQDVIEKCKNIEEELNQLKFRFSENHSEINELTPWMDLDINLGAERETKNTQLIIGTIEASTATECFEEIKAILEKGEHQILGKWNNQIRFWLIADKKNLKKIELILQKHGFSDFVPTNRTNTVTNRIKTLETEQNEISSKIDNLNAERKKIAQKTPELKIVYDHLSWLKSKEAIKKNFLYTESTTSIEGFIPKQQLINLEQSLQKLSKGIVVEEIAITEEDIVPVGLENKKFVRPFEGVMRLFGLPSKDEADPTPYLTPFFLIFFGFCLTDVGYGLILGIGLMLLLKLYKFPEDMKNMLKLLMYAGWSTVVMGVLFGGYFGLTPEQAPSFMVNANKTAFKFQVFDPINNLNAVMGFAYGLGLFQLWLGTLMKGIQTAKSNKWNAMQAHFIYNILILVLIFYSLAVTGVFLENYSEMLKNMMYIVGIFAIWGSAYETKNIFIRPLMGLILFIQEIIGIFSGVLSYSRLFALGLSTGIIALVFNTIALATLDLMPIYIAIPVMLVIILVGHILNICLNVLGAFIHSARLQFVEFFGKFLIGGGKEFTPFKKEMKYVYFE